MKESSLMQLGHTVFETELDVRPDDIDMNQHVHASRYQDYVLAARYEQMRRCYGMAMEEFTKLGLGWFVNTAHIEYRRALKLGDRMAVRTWVQEMEGDRVRVDFEILRLPQRKQCCTGWFGYTLVNITTGRSTPIPEEIAAKYAV